MALGYNLGNFKLVMTQPLLLITVILGNSLVEGGGMSMTATAWDYISVYLIRQIILTSMKSVCTHTKPSK